MACEQLKKSAHARSFNDFGAVQRFANLDLADEVILLPIYPARELPIEGVNSEMVLGKMKRDNLPAGRQVKRVMTKEELMNWVENDFSKTVNKEFGEVLVTAGAGDIDTLISSIKDLLLKPL